MYKFIHCVLTLLLVTLLAGCATEPEKTQIPAAQAPETTSIPEAINIIPVGSNSEEVTLEVLLSEGNTIQQGRSKNRYLGGYNDIDNISIDVTEKMLVPQISVPRQDVRSRVRRHRLMDQGQIVFHDWEVQEHASLHQWR